MARLINSKPWSTDLELSLSALCPSLSKTAVLQTLRLIKTPSKALNFFNWADNNDFNHNEQSYFMILEILGSTRNLNSARNFLYSVEKRSSGSVKLKDRFFNSLIRSYGRAGLYQESIKVFSSMKSMGISPSVVTFNSLLSILLKRGRTNMAKEVFDEMLSTYGVKPDTYSFNILIRGFCKNLMVDEGFRFFQEMSKFECEADVITFNTLVDGLCRAGKVKIARNVLKGMQKKSSKLSPNVVTYTTLIRGYCMNQETDEALDVFNEMVASGLKPNVITYNTLIQGLCESKKLNKIKEIFEGTIGDGEFVPDTCTFTTLINAQCNLGNLNEALKIYEKMLELRVPSDSATYSVLIRSLCQAGEFNRAEEFFDELSGKEILLHDVGCKPLAAAYNPIFEYLCENGKTQKAERVFRQLLKRGTQDPKSYKTLIIGNCKEGTFETAYELLVLMLRREFEPGVETYETLIKVLLQKNEPIIAFKTLEKMMKSGHLPETSIFHSVLKQLLQKGFSKESARFMMAMLDKKIRQNVNLSSDTVRLLFKSGLKDKAFEIVGLLYENGYSIDMGKVIEFLCTREKLSEGQQLLLFSLEKHQTVDVEMCNTVILGLCKTHKVEEAFRLYYELVEKGIQQNMSCLNDLRIALEAAGRSKEAKFVYKRMVTPQKS